MKKWTFIPLLALIFTACQSEKTEEGQEKTFFPVLSYLNSQVAHVDTSLYCIVKITTVGDKSDTVYLKREEFRKAAADFL